MKVFTRPFHAVARLAAGFTLVENAVALTIAAIMLTSLYGAFASGFSTVRNSRENLRATQIMLTRLEAIRLCSFDQIINPIYTPTTFTETFDPQDTVSGGGVSYNGTFTWAVPPAGTVPDSYRLNMLLLTVSLSWTSGNILHTRTMQTYAALDGIQQYVKVGK